MCLCVDMCIMSAEAKARAFRPEDKELDDDTHAAQNFLGVNKEYEGKFPNIEMNAMRDFGCVTPQYVSRMLGGKFLWMRLPKH